MTYLAHYERTARAAGRGRLATPSLAGLIADEREQDRLFYEAERAAERPKRTPRPPAPPHPADTGRDRTTVCPWPTVTDDPLRMLSRQQCVCGFDTGWDEAEHVAVAWAAHAEEVTA